MILFPYLDTVCTLSIVDQGENAGNKSHTLLSGKDFRLREKIQFKVRPV